MEFRGRQIADSADPAGDRKALEDEYSDFMNRHKDAWFAWEQEKSALELHHGSNFMALDEALTELAERPRFREFVTGLQQFQERWRRIERLNRLTSVAPDGSDSWAWMFKEKIAPKNGRPGHPYHIPTKHVHFQEGPRRRSSVL